MASKYGKREDGTPKKSGWLGEIPVKGGVMTEKSIGLHFDGAQRLIPSIVPSTTKKELEQIYRGEITTKIKDKAVKHARQRLSKGKSPFYEGGKR